MGKRFLYADPHFFDENILKMEPARHVFQNITQMHNNLIKNWNDTVTENDEVFVLGDFINSAKEEDIKEILNALKGKITLIVGNHDKINVEYLRNNTRVTVYDHPIILDEFWILSHEPMYVSEAMPYANVFGHVHGNPMYKTVSSRSYCVSAERTGFKPINFNTVKEEVLAQN